MTVAVTLITTENNRHDFTLDTSGNIDLFLNHLKINAQSVFGKPLIVGSSEGTEIFAPESIARIEMKGAFDVESMLPDTQVPSVTTLLDDEPDPDHDEAYGESQYRVGMTVFFRGGSALRLRVEGKRKTALAERLMSLTGIFARPVVLHRLAQGGLGLINPQAVTHTRISPPVPELPRDAWLAQNN